MFFFIALSLLTVSYAQNREEKKKEKKYNEKGEIIKTGWVFGPLPVVGFDSDLGFQYGITTDIFNYGNGKNYPKYDFKMNFEASTYTKGSSILRFYGDFGNVIPKSKLFLDVAYLTDKNMSSMDSMDMLLLLLIMLICLMSILWIRILLFRLSMTRLFHLFCIIFTVGKSEWLPVSGIP